MTNYKKLKKEYNHAYEKLYIDILKIGSKFVNRGISYNELQAILSEKGYDFSLAGIEPAVKQWFFDSFHHTGPDDRPCKHVSDLDKYEHLDCHFMLKGAYCLKLVDHEISQSLCDRIGGS